MQYRFVHRYKAGSWDFQAGAVQEFAADVAAHILRDSPGCMEPDAPVVGEPSDVEARDLTGPPHDRMVHEPARRRSKGA